MEKFLRDLVGKSEIRAEEIAQNHGYEMRVLAKDGESYVATADVRMDRVNVFLRDGSVVKAWVG